MGVSKQFIELSGKRFGQLEVISIEIDRLDVGKIMDKNVKSPSDFIQKWRLKLR